MKKIFLITVLFLLCFSTIAFADTGKIINEIETEKITIPKDSEIEILQDYQNGYRIKYRNYKLTVPKTSVLKISKLEKGKEVEYATQGYIKKGVKLTINDKMVTLKKGTKVALYDYSNGIFKLKDVNNYPFYIPEMYITLIEEELEDEFNDIEYLQKMQEELLKSISQKIGVPYVWGGESRYNGYDCSGFTKAVYGDLGFIIPKYSRDQSKIGKTVSTEDLLIGDLFFFDSTGDGLINHTGIYVGNGNMSHASSLDGEVIIEKLQNYIDNRDYVKIVTVQRIFDYDFLKQLSAR